MTKRVGVIAIVVAVCGCGLIAGIDPLQIDPCYDAGCADVSTDIDATDAPLDVGTDAHADATPDGGCPAAMVQIPASSPFCIDSTEVTFAAYQKFLTAKGSDTSGQSAICASNTTYAPAGIGSGNFPVSNIDYCDAVAYCLWAGKRLCGKIGGGLVLQTDFTDPSVNQWLYACSAGGTQAFPYGATYSVADCNTDLDASAPLQVGTQSKCVGGFPGLYDMVGNVWELIDAPEKVQNTSLIYAAAYTTTDPTFKCDTAFAFNITFHAPDVGFRCCSP